MILKLQLYSLICSFIFGIFVYLTLGLIHKLIYSNNVYVKIFFSLIYSLVISIIYFIILLNINNGIIHIYFLLMVIAGYTVANFVYVKLFVKR